MIDLRVPATLTAASVAELAELANENAGKLITVDADALLSLCWAWADSEGGCLQTFVERERELRKKPYVAPSVRDVPRQRCKTCKAPVFLTALGTQWHARGHGHCADYESGHYEVEEEPAAT